MLSTCSIKPASDQLEPVLILAQALYFMQNSHLIMYLLLTKNRCHDLSSSGDNQRLEFLGDSLLKYVSTDYLFRHFPRHHEGHLSLLKNSLVNKYTQAAVCSELGLDRFIVRREENSINQSTTPDATANQSSAQAAVTPLGIAAQKQNVKYRADLLEGKNS